MVKTVGEVNMNYIQRFFGHLNTINAHKWQVMKNCFRAGIPIQGLLHDLSKYAPVEFFAGVKYYLGYKSPNYGQKKATGYSAAWLHHKGRNKHHFEYWIDYSLEKEICGMRMPDKYVVEMFCDRVAASKIYQKENYTDSHPLEYFLAGRPYYIMHPEVDKLLFELLTMLAEQGEDAVFAYIRKNVLHKRRYS